MDEMNKKDDQEQMVNVEPSINVNDAPIEGEVIDIPEKVVEDKAPAIEEKKDENAVVDEVIEEKATDDIIEEKKDEEIKEDTPPEVKDNKEDVVEAPNEDVTDKIEEVNPEDKPVDEVVEEKPEETIDDVKRELEEIKTIRDEENAIRQFEIDATNDDKYLANLANTIASNLEQAIVNLGVDVTKTLEDIKKENPEKAFKIKQMVEEAQRIQASEEARVNEARKAKLQDIVFKRAGRLLDAFKLSNEESDIACEALINILNEAGLKNLDNDLMVKVRLAVGQAKLLAPKVENVAKEVVDIASEAKDIVDKVVDPEVTPEDMAKSEKVEEEIVEDKPVVEEEPKIDVAAFEEGATVGGTSAVEPSMGDLLSELNKIKDTRERVAFYRAHQKEIEAQMKQAHSKKVD